MERIRFQRIVDEAKLPSKAHEDDACFDLYSATEITVRAQSPALVATGFNVAIPDGHVGLVCSRSGMASRGVFVANAPGIVDAGYRGELKVILYNTRDTDFTVLAGDRIGQLMLQPVLPTECVEVDSLEETDRGTGGFGSTGA